ncbi:MAG: DUF5989 family protein [Opitutaceae bacterium]
MNDPKTVAFERASSARQAGMLRELYCMLRHNKKYWMIPLFGALLLIGGLIVLGGTAAAPFIYALF